MSCRLPRFDAPSPAILGPFQSSFPSITVRINIAHVRWSPTYLSARQKQPSKADPLKSLSSISVIAQVRRILNPVKHKLNLSGCAPAINDAPQAAIAAGVAAVATNVPVTGHREARRGASIRPYPLLYHRSRHHCRGRCLACPPPVVSTATTTCSAVISKCCRRRSRVSLRPNPSVPSEE